MLWLGRGRPDSADAAGAGRVVDAARQAAKTAGIAWRETNYLLLRRGPYLIGAGLDESIEGAPHAVNGRFVNLFDPDLRVRREVVLAPGSRWFLLDLDAVAASGPRVLLSACKALTLKQTSDRLTLAVEGVAHTPAVVLLAATTTPRSVTLAGKALQTFEFDAQEHLLRIRFENDSAPRELGVEF